MNNPSHQQGDPSLLGQIVSNARRQKGLTQKDLSAKTGIAQSDISRLEQSNANPSVRTLERIASGLGMQLHIEFVPVDEP